jgi:conjugal transfer mating pair stabilization protein TraG
VALLKPRKFKKILRRFKSAARRRRYLFAGLLGLVCIVIGIMLYMNTAREIYVTRLLDTIAKAESGGNYNAYYGNSTNSKLQFTSMSVDEVLRWQQRFIEGGSPSSAVGRYQFINATLQSLASELSIDENTLFDQQIQDRLAARLLEKRGLSSYMAKNISKEAFAHNLSKEWAGLPQAIGENPEQSYYNGDGLNKSRVSLAEVYSSIATLREL